MLESDWSEITLTLNNANVNVPGSVTISLKDKCINVSYYVKIR